MTPFSLASAPDDLLDLLNLDEEPRRIQLASVGRPTFTQQLTVLRDELPGFARPLATIHANHRSVLQALDRPM